MYDIYNATKKHAECERRLARAEKKFEDTGKPMWKEIAEQQRLLIAGYRYEINKVNSKFGGNN